MVLPLFSRIFLRFTQSKYAFPPILGGPYSFLTHTYPRLFISTHTWYAHLSTPPIIHKEKRPCSLGTRSSWLKSGNYLSSRQFSASTFGVKELNFCVRNGNRWVLFAIITAMVISIAHDFPRAQHIYLINKSSSED